MLKLINFILALRAALYVVMSVGHFVFLSVHQFIKCFKKFYFPRIVDVGDLFMNIGDKTAENTSCVLSGLKRNYF